MKFTILVLLSFISCRSYGQHSNNILDIGDGTYQYADFIGKLHDMKFIFKNNQEQISNFDAFNRNRKSQKIFNCVGGGIVSIGFGLGVYGILENSMRFSDGTYLLIGITTGTIIASPFFLVGNLIYGMNKSKWKDRILDFDSRPEYSELHENKASLHLGITNDGVGVILKF